jgi:predicted nuclease of predicted toxin-antitoxin system
MLFKVDENLPAEATEILGAAGHDAISVLEQELGGEPDKEIARVCRKEKRIIVTLDTDFADIRVYPPQEYPGLIVLRLKRQDKATVLSVLRRLIKMLDDERIENRLWIVEENRVRVRE